MELSRRMIGGMDRFFKDSNMVNSWVKDRYMSVYLRKSVRLRGCGDTKWITTLDIANISVKPNYQNKGLASSLIDFVIERRILDAIWVENILHPNLIHIVEKRGFELFGERDFSPSYLRMHD